MKFLMRRKLKDFYQLRLTQFHCNLIIRDVSQSKKQIVQSSQIIIQTIVLDFSQTEHGTAFRSYATDQRYKFHEKSS